MADYQSSYTGAQIDSAVAKATKLPTTSSGDSGKTLQVDSSGNIVANTVSGGGTQLYKHSIRAVFTFVEGNQPGGGLFGFDLITNTSSQITLEDAFSFFGSSYDIWPSIMVCSDTNEKYFQVLCGNNYCLGITPGSTNVIQEPSPFAGFEFVYTYSNETDTVTAL